MAALALDGVTKPELLIKPFTAEVHPPPVGVTVMLNGEAFVQNSGFWVMYGVVVRVIVTLIVVNDGHTVAIGVELIEYVTG